MRVTTTLLVAAVLGAACDVSDPATDDAGAGATSLVVPAVRFPTVPVCWEAPTGVVPVDGFASLRAALHDHLAHTWSAHSALAFPDAGACPPSVSSTVVRVQLVGIYVDPPYDPQLTYTMTWVGTHRAVIAVPMEFDWLSGQWYRVASAARERLIATRAFGELAGIHLHPCGTPQVDGDARQVSADDADSVMNVCPPELNTDGHLSREDILGARRAFGWRNATDYNADGRSDLAVFRPSYGLWFVTSAWWALPFGSNGDFPLAADFDHDARTDLVRWSPLDGTWTIRPSGGGAVQSFAWGAYGDLPQTGDLDGDGRLEAIVFRPWAGTWYIRHEDGTTETVPGFGGFGDTPVVADYDGDGQSDLALWHESTGVWTVRASSDGVATVQWGNPGDIPVPGAYHVHGGYEYIVFRPSDGTWKLKRASWAGQQVQWGIAGDVPLSMDWDGDGEAEQTVWRPSTGVWYGLNLAPLAVGQPIQYYAIQYGQLGDLVPARTVKPY